VAAIRQMAVWRALRAPSSLLLLVAVALCLVRARDQWGIDASVGSTTAHVVPEDLVLAALFVAALVVIRRTGVAGIARLPFAAALAFSALVVGTGAANGSATAVSAAKLAELGVLGLGIYAFMDSSDVLEAIVDVLLVFTIVADAVGVIKFVTGGGGRQSSFLGEHDFAALATLPLLYGFVLVVAGRRSERAAVAIVAGTIGCILGAALASLVGLYLGALVLVVVAAARRYLRLRALLVILATVGVLTAGTLTIRAGDLGFLQSWFGKPASRPGQYASSWSQRLIYAYVGGRVFLDHPLLGTGWYPLLPPSTFDRYLPAAHRRFSDQPAAYFPPAAEPFIPQQAYDQVLYELGTIGGATFLTLLVGLAAAGARAARARAMLPATWLAASVGALAGEGLFGGTPLLATFWIAAGVCVAVGDRPEAAS
jgi:hypothetical protein